MLGENISPQKSGIMIPSYSLQNKNKSIYVYLAKLFAKWKSALIFSHTIHIIWLHELLLSVYFQTTYRLIVRTQRPGLMFLRSPGRLMRTIKYRDRS